MPNKNDSLSFSELTSSMRAMDWYLPFDVASNWVFLATEFGKFKGYIEERNTSSLYSIYYGDEDVKQSRSATYRVKKADKQEREAFGKWYDRFNGVNMRNRYRR
jgi:hypothetical protein